jgi:hypothetical protein
MVFVSYTFFTKTKQGFGSININADGFYSMEDVKDAVEVIKPICMKDLKTNDKDIDVIILNWRKYDPAP